MKQKEVEVKTAALELNFELAAILRDEIVVIKQELGKRDKKKTALPDPNKPDKPKIKKPPRHGRTR